MTRNRKKLLRYNVLVRYLPLDLTQGELYSLFSVVGSVSSVKLMCSKTGSEGYGFVNFATEADAQRAIDYFDGYRITPRKCLKVSWSVPGQRLGCKVFVTNLPLHWEQSDFAAAFQPLGQAEEVRILSLRNGRRSGFILFISAEQARNAIETMDGHVPPGWHLPLSVQLSKKDAKKLQKMEYRRRRSERQQQNYESSLRDVLQNDEPSSENEHTRRLFFYNASTNLPKDFFNSLLGNYGTIQDLTLQTDNNGTFLGMGFVTYREERSPKICYEGLNQAPIQGISLYIKVNC